MTDWMSNPILLSLPELLIFAFFAFTIYYPSSGRPPVANSSIPYQATNTDGGRPKTGDENPMPTEKPPYEGWHPEERKHRRIEKWYWLFTSLLTAGAVAGAVATVIISNNTLREAHNATIEAHRQAEIAQSALIVGNRAWVTAVSAELNRPTDVTAIARNGVISIELKITFENVGHSPAKVLSFIFPAIGNTPELDSKWNRMCDNVDAAAKAAETNSALSVGYVIPPNGKFTAPIAYMAPVAGMAGSIRNPIFLGKIYILGCARYVDANSTPKHTRYCFEPAASPDGTPDFKNMSLCQSFQDTE